MRKIGILGLVGVLTLVLAGCGGGSSPSVFTEWIDSNRSVDADITKDLGTGIVGVPFLASSTGNVLAGITVDSVGTSVADTRGFLNFPLSTIPLNASIRFASVTVFLNQVTLWSSLLPSPFFIDLIDTTAFPPPVQASDYSAVLAATRTFNFINTDQGNFVEIVVTSLMQEAQRRGLSSFEVRLGFDEAAFNANINTTRGLVEIDDRALVPSQRPFLTVEYSN
ncbi:MAG: hypothetical protein M0T69_00470 [Deltaproteobacteria bacterium]|nr:hypothetical protein [Deltaproteobacteria bacterium]